jgi:hypothetical protein
VPTLTTGAAALGQDIQIAKAPEINPWIPLGILFFLIAVVLIASFQSSRRGHQD